MGGAPDGAPRRPGRPAVLSREKIVAAASSAEDLDSLTMRELAAGLGVSHGALYRWVKNRDELVDLISEVLVERVLAPADSGGAPREWLSRIAWRMHDEFLALPGYATRLARPHQHNAQAIEHLRRAVTSAFVDLGADDHLARQSWHIFITCTVGWLAAAERPLDLGADAPRFDVFLDVLLRGLPARAPDDGSRIAD